MDEITIRPARSTDARAVARLDVETWRSTYAGVLSTSYLVGLSQRRREIGWRMAIMREPRDVRVAVDVGRHDPRLWQLRAEPQRTALSGRGVYALRRP